MLEKLTEAQRSEIRADLERALDELRRLIPDAAGLTDTVSLTRTGLTWPVRAASAP